MKWTVYEFKNHSNQNSLHFVAYGFDGYVFASKTGSSVAKRCKKRGLRLKTFDTPEDAQKWLDDYAKTGKQYSVYGTIKNIPAYDI